MDDLKLFDAEFRLADIVWEREPVNSTELVGLCAEKLGWKKSTTYTMLRKLCERGVLQNENAVVTARVTREQVRRYQSEALLEKAFDGSLPVFVASFLRDKKLTSEEALKLQCMIEEAAK